MPEKKEGYLKYAIGEIALLVISILLAIKVNKWTEAQAQAKDEFIALTNLKIDYQFNQEKINELIVETEKNIASSIKVLNQCGSNYSDDPNFNMDSLMVPIIQTPKYYPHNGFLDDLLNTGDLEIIENDLLRSKLSCWHPLVQNLKKRELIAVGANSEIVSFYVRKGSWKPSDHYGNKGLIFPKSGFNKDNSDLLQFLEFENLVKTHVIYMFNLIIRQKEIRKTTTEIFELIQQELSGKMN